MRLVRRLLTSLSFILAIALLIRYRQIWEPAIEAPFSATEETHNQHHDEAQGGVVDPKKDETPASRKLPQVIFPHVYPTSTKADEQRPVNGFPTSTEQTNDLDSPISNDGELNRGPLATAEGAGEEQQAQADLGAFWAQWSQAIYDARPNITKIKLRSQASSQPPNDRDAARQPFRSLIMNNAADIDSMRVSHAQFVQELEREFGVTNNSSSEEGKVKTEHTLRQWRGMDQLFKGKGVVMVGGGEYYGPAIISIHMLRRSGSSLPVEVFVPDDEEYEEQICEKYFPRLGAKCVVLSHILEKSSITAGDEADKQLKITHYQLKSLALLFSSFSDVLMLDSDSIPLIDPLLHIFDTEPYKSEGMIVWPDFWAATESPKFWQIAGWTEFPKNLPSTASETGQLAVNKATHLAPLLLAAYYNIFGPNHYYTLQSQGALGQGDKETFMAAAVALNATYYRVKTPVVSLGRHDGQSQRATAMVQHSPPDDLASRTYTAAAPVFLHSNTPKMNAGHLVDEGDLIAHDGVTRLRLLGSKEEQQRRFGFDVERSLWDLLVQTGCELASVVREWKHRKLLCKRLEEHYKLTFAPSDL